MINEQIIKMTRSKIEEIIEKGIKKYYMEKDAFGGSKIIDCIMREIDLEQAFCQVEEI